MSDGAPTQRERRSPALVSVIIRTRNRPRLLAEALDSVAAQTWPAVEAVVINDGGTAVDGIIGRFGQRLDVTHHRLDPAVGRVAAANAGLERARGDWVTFLDDDDVLRPGGIEALVRHAEGMDEAVYGEVPARVYREGEARLFRIFGRSYDPDLLLFENFIPIIGCVMPREAVVAAGGLDESLECFEDWDLFMRLGDVVSFRFVPEEVAEYRIFGGGFLTGEGGQERQRRGREQIYGKHRSRLTPAALSRCQELVKTRLIPEEATRLGGEAYRRLEEHARFLKNQLVAAEEGMSVLRTRLETLERERVRGLAIEPSIDTTVPQVSVILVNYNGREHLERCLPALHQTRRVPIEVIVVDNASIDDSVTWLRQAFPDVTVIEQKDNIGFGAANAAGVRAATSAFVAFLNTDTVVDPEWLLPLLETLMRDPDAGAACSTLRLLNRPEILNAHGGGMSKLGFGFDHDFGVPYRPATATREVLFPTAAAMLMRRRDFERLGGFDPAFFMYHEDVDLGWRIWLSGQKVLLVEASEVLHLFGGTTRRERSLTWREKLGARHSFRSILVCAQPLTILKAVKGLVRLWRQQHTLGVGLHVLAWNLEHLPSTIARRRGVQRDRKISDRELFERGLISIGPYPAPAPEVPRGRGEQDAERWIVSHVLLPGQASALGRLGPGWYRPERIGNGLARVTCAMASCWLKTQPESSGALLLRVHVPPEAAGRGLTVRCNGVEVHETLDGSLWQEIRFWVVANARGLLRIELATEPWVPHHLSENWDFRSLGVAVESIRFVPDHPSVQQLNPMVSVIVTTFNRRAILERALAAWERQSWERLELIVVDDGSDDGTWRALESWRGRLGYRLQARIIHQSNSGQGSARNRGLEEAHGELVIFAGDDIIPEPSFVDEHVHRHLDAGDPCAVVGLTDWDRNTLRVTRAMELVNREGHQFGYAFMHDGEDVPYTCFYTSNISVPRDVLGAQPFDPAFRVYGWEDVELGYRLSLAGLRIVYAASARAVHHHAMDFTSLYRRQIAVGRSLATLLDLHPEIAADDVMPPPRARLAIRMIGRVAPLIVPPANLLDRIGVPVPRRLLRSLLEAGFVTGRRETGRS